MNGSRCGRQAFIPEPAIYVAPAKKWFLASELMTRCLEIEVSARDTGARRLYGSIQDRPSCARYMFFLLDDAGT